MLLPRLLFRRLLREFVFLDRSVLRERKDPLHEAYRGSFPCQTSEVLHKHTEEPSCIQLRRIITVSDFQGKSTPSILMERSGFFSQKSQF